MSGEMKAVLKIVEGVKELGKALLPDEVARFEQAATFFALMPGVGSEAPNRNSAMRPSVISSFLRRSGVWNARTKAVSMRSPRFG